MSGSPHQRDQSEDQARRSAFWSQYIGVIMIVLTFMVGSFATRALNQGQKQETGQLHQATASIAEMNYADLFIPDQTEPVGPVFDALSFILQQHDLNYRIEVSSHAATDSNSLSDDDAMALALARSVSLYRRFIEQGIPPQAVSVSAQLAHSPFQARAYLNQGSP